MPALSWLLTFLRLQNILGFKVGCLWEQWMKSTERSTASSKTIQGAHPACSINHPAVRAGSEELGSSPFRHEGFHLQWMYQRPWKSGTGIKPRGKRKVASQGWMHYNINTLQGETFCKKGEEMLGNSMSPSPACDSEHTQLMGKSATMTFFACWQGGLFYRLRVGLLKQEQCSAALESAAHQSANDIGPERMPLILLEVMHWKFPQYITVSGSYISTTKFKFCLYCSY